MFNKVLFTQEEDERLVSLAQTHEKSKIILHNSLKEEPMFISKKNITIFRRKIFPQITM
jgi:hypothetical protein